MTPAEIRGLLDVLERHYKRSYNESVLGRMVQDLLPFTKRHFSDACDEIIYSRTTLPTPKDLVEDVRRRHNEAQMEAEQKSREENERQKRELDRPHQGSGMSFKIAQALIPAILSSKMTRRQFLDKIREADKLCPGVGWATAGANLQRMYEKNGSPMDNPPSGYMGDRHGHL